MFKITKKEATDLRYIYEMFYTQNGNALYRYFKRNEYMKVELFQYLLDYYKIDMAYELVEDEKKILTFEFFKPTFESGSLGGFFKPTFESGSLGNGATEIMTKPVDNAQFCIYLNSAFMEKTIEIDGNGKVVDSESKDLLMDLDSSDIEFIDNEFIINSAEDEEKKITGITYIIAEMFIEWISEFKHKKYQLIKFDSGWHKKIKNFNHSDMLYEFISAIDYPIRVYTSHYSNNSLALDEDGKPLTTSSISIFNNVSFRMMKMDK
jgi:hypothetical protein